MYLDTLNPAMRFDEDDLELVAASRTFARSRWTTRARLDWLEQENLRLTTEINLRAQHGGRRTKMKEVYQLLSRVAPT